MERRKNNTFYQEIYQTTFLDLIESISFVLLCFLRISHNMVGKLKFSWTNYDYLTGKKMR